MNRSSRHQTLLAARLFALSAGLVAQLAFATGPVIVYAPAQDLDATADGIDPSPSFEIQFGPASPTGCSATSCSIAMQADCTGVPGCVLDGQPSNSTSLNICAINPRSGSAQFGISSNTVRLIVHWPASTTSFVTAAGVATWLAGGCGPG